MADTVHIDGLLHLAAMAVAASAAYIGLDRVKAENDRFKVRLRDVQVRVTELLQKLDVLKSGKAELKDIYNTAPMHILCHIAKFEITLGYLRVVHVCKRQRYVPMLGYFRHRADQWAVAFLLIYSLINFLLLTAASLWPKEMEFMFHPALVEEMFWGLTGVVLWIFFTVAVSYRLHDISATCQKFETAIDAHVKTLYDEAAASIPMTTAHGATTKTALAAT